MLVIVKVHDVAVHVMLAVVYIVMETELQLQLSAGRLQWQSGWDAGLCSFVSFIHLLTWWQESDVQDQDFEFQDQDS